MKKIYNEDEEKILVDAIDDDSVKYETIKKHESEEELKDMKK